MVLWNEVKQPRSMDWFRELTLIYSLSCESCHFSAAFLLPLTPMFIPLPFFPPFIPPSFYQLPEELSVWIAALSVQPVRLRDAFWSAVDTDRPVRWDDSHKWRHTQTGTCNVTTLLHPFTTTTTTNPFPLPLRCSPPPPHPKNKYACTGSWRSAQGDEHVSWRDEGKFSLEPERMWCCHVIMSTCTLNVVAARVWN